MDNMATTTGLVTDFARSKPRVLWTRTRSAWRTVEYPYKCRLDLTFIVRCADSDDLPVHSKICSRCDPVCKPDGCGRAYDDCSF